MWHIRAQSWKPQNLRPSNLRKCDTLLRMCDVLISSFKVRWENPLPSTLRKLLYQYRRAIWSILEVLKPHILYFHASIVEHVEKFEVLRRSARSHNPLLSVFLQTDQMWRLMWSSGGYHFCLWSSSSQRSMQPFCRIGLNGKCIKKVEKWFLR